jgi:flavin reductase (DIM6/NTAB) family NADH-FMN oxidoreductase RutF
MLYFDKATLQSLEKIKRLNIVNSITGIKPANLVGTISPDNKTNLAIFSSVIHLGSNPALLGMVVRPAGEVARHTYENIKATGRYTINHVHHRFIQQAHYTSAKFERDESEFAACGFTEIYLADWPAPYVAESTVRMGMQLVEEISIERNGTVLLIGEVAQLYLPPEALNEQGYLDLATAGSAGISGLNTYYTLQKTGSFSYARPGILPQPEEE